MVAQPVLEVYENIKKYVKETKLPKTETPESVASAVQDKLTRHKLVFFFFVSIANIQFQSSKPLILFLHEVFCEIFTSLITHAIKKRLLIMLKHYISLGILI